MHVESSAGFAPTISGSTPASTAIRILLWLALLGCSNTALPAPLSAAEVATTLGTLQDGARQNAIAALARGGQIRAPLSGADGAAILQGATQGARTGAIAELAALFKADLSGPEAEAILGPESVLSEGNRKNAIAALARARRFGPSLGEDAALALKGTTQGARAGAIAEIAPYLRADLPGQSIATILGDATVLSGGNRQNAIAALTSAGKLRAGLSSAEMAQLRQGTPSQPQAGPSAPSPAATASPSTLTAAEVASLNALIDRKVRALSRFATPPYFFSTDGWLDTLNAAFRGSGDLRRQYDAFYFGAYQYRLLAFKRLAGARELVRANKAAAARRSIAESDRYAAMMSSSSSASSAVLADGLGNAAEIQRWAAATYSASKIAVICGSTVLPPPIAARFEAVYAAADFGIAAADTGLPDATLSLVVDKSVSALLTSAGVKNSCDQLLLADPLFLGISSRVDAAVRSPQFRQALADAVASGLAAARRGDAGPIADLVIRKMTDRSAAPLPKLPTRALQLAALVFPFAKLIESIDSAAPNSKVVVQGRRGPQEWTVLANPAPRSIATAHSKGLRAAVFENAQTNQCAIAFGGTEASDLIDWWNDLWQFLGGVPFEYIAGADFASAAIRQCASRKVAITGHSLGGGIALYAYFATGQGHLTYTFNPAGLSPFRTAAQFVAAGFSWAPSQNVVNMVAESFDPSSAASIGRDVISLSGSKLGGEVVLVPVYSWSPTPHLMAPLAEGVGIQRDYCVEVAACR